MMIETLEAARAGHEGIHRLGFAHMPNNARQLTGTRHPREMKTEMPVNLEQANQIRSILPSARWRCHYGYF